MSKRRIVVFSNATGANKIFNDSEAKTWGELKGMIQEADIPTDNVEAIIKGSKQSLVVDDAQLPGTEFTLYLLPKKMKSGIRPKTQDALTDLNKTQLKKVAKFDGLATDGDAAALLKRLRGKQKRRGSDYTVGDIESIMASKAKAKPKKAVSKPKAKKKVVAKAKPAAKKEVISKDKAVEEVAETIPETVAVDELSVDEAKELIKATMEETTLQLVAIVGRIKVTTIAEGIDVFAGLDDEWAELSRELRK